jgi:hypothetical protein
LNAPTRDWYLRSPTKVPFRPEHVRLWHWQRHTGLPGIAEDEFAGFDGSALAGQGFDAAALDGGLADGVFVAEGVEVTGLGAEVLHHQQGDAGEPLVLLARCLHGSAPLVFGFAEDADRDVDVSGTEGHFPVLRIVRSVVQELIGARSHTDAECFREALERVLRHAQRHQPGVADGYRGPGLAGLPPLGGGVDIGRQPPHEFSTGLCILHMELGVRAIVRLGPVAQHRRLDIVEFHDDGAARKVAPEAINECHGPSLTRT